MNNSSIQLLLENDTNNRRSKLQQILHKHTKSSLPQSINNSTMAKSKLQTGSIVDTPSPSNQMQLSNKTTTAGKSGI